MPKFDVSRTTEIKATPEEIFDTIADYGTWTTWSPWLIADPEATVTVSPEPNVVGSKYSWDGEVCGEGSMTHTQLESPKFIEADLHFIKPFKSQSRVTFEIEPYGEVTRVTWNMYGSMPWFLFFLIPMMKPLIGMDYERGLRMLKEWIETGSIRSKTTVQGVQNVGPYRIAGIRTTCDLDEIGPSMDETFSQVKAALEQSGLPEGEPISVYHKYDMKNRVCDYMSGQVIPEQANVPEGLSVWSTPSTKAFHVSHLGAYEHLGNAWSVGHQHIRHNKLKLQKTPCFEIYKNNPGDTDSADLLTEVYLPVK